MLNCHRERRSPGWVTSPPLTCSGSKRHLVAEHVFVRVWLDFFQSFFLSSDWSLATSSALRRSPSTHCCLQRPSAALQLICSTKYWVRHERGWCLLYTVSQYVCDMWSVCSTEVLGALKLSVCQSEPFGVITITMNRWTHTPCANMHAQERWSC